MDVSHVSPGDPIKAADWNAVVDALGGPAALAGASGSPGVRGTIVHAVNVGTTDLMPYDAAGVSGQALPGDNPQGQRVVVVNVRRAENDAEAARLAVCLDRINAGRSGRVMLAGVAWCLADGTGDYAALAVGQTNVALGDSGVAHVLATAGDYALLLWPVGSSAAPSILANWQFVWNEGD